MSDTIISANFPEGREILVLNVNEPQAPSASVEAVMELAERLAIEVADLAATSEGSQEQIDTARAALRAAVEGLVKGAKE